jgi:predicted metal-dependent peptidase
MKLIAEKRIERAHVLLMQSKEFCLFSGVFMVGKVTVSDKMKTAGTNGRDVVYGRKFVDSLSDKQLAFLVVHEAMHKAYRHMTVWKHLTDKRVANMAMDYVINLQIQNADPRGVDVSMPRDADGKLIGLLDEKYKDMDTKQVYDLLLSKKKEEGEKGEKGEEGNGGGGGIGHGEGQDDEESDSPGDGGNGLDEHDWDGAESFDEKEVEELGREIDSALREGSILAGKMKGNVPREIQDLLHPKVDWKEALREFIKVHTRGGDQSTWRRPNRKFLASGIIMPSSESHKAKTFVVGIDTSGSIGGPELARFLGELQSIADEVMPECVELLYWDSHVAGHETYRDGEVQNIGNSTKPRGGGGTSPNCVPAYMEEKRIEAQCVIMLTDGYFGGGGCGDWARTNAPVLWCVVGNKSFVPTVGQSVLVE